MPKANLGQAMVLKGGIAMPNKNGTAPGMWYEENKTIFISMPGVPYEMKALMEEDFLPMIKSYFKTPFLYKRTILTQGIGESSLMELIEDWENSLASENIKLAYLPQPGMVRLRLSSSSGEKEEIQQKVNSKIEELKKIIPEFIWGEEKQTLEEVVGLELNHRNQTLSTAESCTGGYIAHLITSISGSSQYFFGSIVSYANEVKQNSLDVSPVAIKVHGAVSKQVVEQMAKGVKTKLNTDFSIATSGIAGPLGGTSEKPVGTVWIAVSGPKRTISEKFNFGNHRTRNIWKTALQALNMLRKEILFQNP
jgi:nicotinamide-nucleotide amidase